MGVTYRQFVRERELKYKHLCFVVSGWWQSPAAVNQHINKALPPTKAQNESKRKKWKQLYLISQATLFLFLLFLSMVKPFQPSKVESETANTPERGRESERKDFYHFWRNRNRNVAIDNYFSWNDVICKRMFFCDFGRVLCSHRQKAHWKMIEYDYSHPVLHSYFLEFYFCVCVRECSRTNFTCNIRTFRRSEQQFCSL